MRTRFLLSVILSFASFGVNWVLSHSVEKTLLPGIVVSWALKDLEGGFFMLVCLSIATERILLLILKKLAPFLENLRENIIKRK